MATHKEARAGEPTATVHFEQLAVQMLYHMYTASLNHSYNLFI